MSEASLSSSESNSAPTSATASFSSEPIPTQIQRNPIQPGRELRLSLEALEAAEGPQKGLLTNVASIFLATQDAIRESEDLSLPPYDELVEGVCISIGGQRYELFVGLVALTHDTGSQQHLAVVVRTSRTRMNGPLRVH